MTRFRILYDREHCIGDFECLVDAPGLWQFNDDGRADLAGASYNKRARRWERVIDEEEYPQFAAAAEHCPAGAIVIEALPDREGTGEFFPAFGFGSPWRLSKRRKARM